MRRWWGSKLAARLHLEIAIETILRPGVIAPRRLQKLQVVIQPSSLQHTTRQPTRKYLHLVPAALHRPPSLCVSDSTWHFSHTSIAMSRAPPPGGSGRMPFGGASGLAGSSPRVPIGQGRPYGGDGNGQGYGASPGYMASGPRSPGMPRQGEKGPSMPQGAARQVPLRVEKVTDKSLQSRLIYGNL